MADIAREARAFSLEQDLLWCVLDHDAVPHILDMARDHWDIDAVPAWEALLRQAALGRLRAYRGEDPPEATDLAQVPFEQAARDYELFVEPTQGTFTRLNEMALEPTAPVSAADAPLAIPRP